MPASIRCGGQTGADRAAMDVALALGLPVFGWCPRGRLAEDGPIAPHYPLQETPLSDPGQRTRWNVRDADGTLILCTQEPTGGTALTLAAAQELDRPVLVQDPTREVVRVRAWIDRLLLNQLNIAGPRESESPSIYRLSTRFLNLLLRNPD